jgi:hypothetical protein
MKLTARKLELYDKPGRGHVANKISAAVTAAAKQAIATIGRRYDRDKASRAICDAISKIVSPVIFANPNYGASDSEPSRAIRSEMCNQVAKRYKLEQWENEELYYQI